VYFPHDTVGLLTDDDLSFSAHPAFVEIIAIFIDASVGGLM